MIYHLHQKELKLKMSKSLSLIYMIKVNMLFTFISLKQTLNHRLVFQKIHRVIRFNKKAWLKPYIDMNTKLRKKSKQ